MNLQSKLKRLGIELDCELETRGETKRAKMLKEKIDKLKKKDSIGRGNYLLSPEDFPTLEGKIEFD